MQIASHLRRGLNRAPYESERAQKLNKEKEKLPTHTPLPLLPTPPINKLRNKNEKTGCETVEPATGDLPPEKSDRVKDKTAHSHRNCETVSHSASLHREAPFVALI